VFRHILVPLDGSPLAECVLPHVVALADLHDASVALLRILEVEQERRTALFSDPLDLHLAAEVANAYLAEVAQRLSRAGVFVETTRLSGSPAEQIVTFARQSDVDLIVMSSHGRSGLSAWHVSSVTQKVASRASRSVMIVRAYVPSREGHDLVPYRRVLAPRRVFGSSDSRQRPAR
jgi:nucleotide-binding universal stress UspA family protein